MNKQSKLFEYDELFALCLLCAGHAALIAAEAQFKAPIEGRKMIEKKIKECIALRWNDSEKRTYQD